MVRFHRCWLTQLLGMLLLPVFAVELQAQTTPTDPATAGNSAQTAETPETKITIYLSGTNSEAVRKTNAFARYVASRTGVSVADWTPNSFNRNNRSHLSETSHDVCCAWTQDLSVLAAEHDHHHSSDLGLRLAVRWGRRIPLGHDPQQRTLGSSVSGTRSTSAMLLKTVADSKLSISRSDWNMLRRASTESTSPVISRFFPSRSSATRWRQMSPPQQ